MIRKVAVLGAGTMGAGIAQACAQAGYEVVLRDLTDDPLKTVLSRLRAPLDERVAAGKMSQTEVDGIFERLATTTDMGEAVSSADLVVEAVFEDMKVKREVFGEADRLAPEHCLFATNTSSLRVADLAEITKRPERFGGLHFFFPANINKLLEVVSHPGTSDATRRDLLAFGRSIGKIVIEVGDRQGFCVNRFFVPWVNESVRMLDEGVADIPTIEAAAKRAFAIGMGPFELMNVTGVPISLHAQRTLHDAFGAFYEPAKGLVEQVEGKKGNWSLDGTPDEGRFDAVADRLLGVTFAIASHLVEEDVATPVATDKGAVVGLRWKRGPFAMMNAMGTGEALALVERLHAQWGDALPVPESLAMLAETGGAWELPKVHVSQEGPAAVLTIQRPEALNALNAGVLADLDDAITLAERTPGVRAIVLTGEGTAFVSGADIKAMADKTPWEARAYAQLGQRVTRRLEKSELPVIAAVNGYAFGGGLELALAADILLVAEEATLGLPEVSLGIQPGFGGSQRLPRRIGRQAALEIILTGRRFSGTEAAALGLALRSVPRSELMGVALELVDAVAANAPLAVASAKASVHRGIETDLDAGLALELESSSLLFGTADQKEGMQAFLERRKPAFQGE